MGNYHVKIVRDDWCWEANQHEIEVSTADVTVPVFKHVGFAVNVVSSHDASVSNTCLCLSGLLLKILSHVFLNSGNFTGHI